MSHTDLLTLHAREKLQMPDPWRAYLWECLPKGAREVQVYHIRGAIAPLHERGTSAGQPNWRRTQPGTTRDVYITPNEHDAWVDAWEQRTGHCRQCLGTGQELVAWHIHTGTRYRACLRCEGTGARKEAAGVEQGRKVQT